MGSARFRGRSNPFSEQKKGPAGFPAGPSRGRKRPRGAAAARCCRHRRSLGDPGTLAAAGRTEGEVAHCRLRRDGERSTPHPSRLRDEDPLRGAACGAAVVGRSLCGGLHTSPCKGEVDSLCFAFRSKGCRVGGRTAAPRSTPTPTLPLAGGGSRPSLPPAMTTSHRNPLFRGRART